MTEQAMQDKLAEAFPGAQIIVTDMTGGGSNFEVRISSDAFDSLNRVQRHQKVMGVFSAELQSGEVHAMTIKAISPTDS